MIYQDILVFGHYGVDRRQSDLSSYARQNSFRLAGNSLLFFIASPLVHGAGLAIRIEMRSLACAFTVRRPDDEQHTVCALKDLIAAPVAALQVARNKRSVVNHPPACLDPKRR
jgi:hypothetical protein